MTDLTTGLDVTSGPLALADGQSFGQRSRAGMDYTPPVRKGAFKAAGRHTARVRFLRRAIILGAVFGVSVIAIVAAFDPFRHLPHGVSISGVGVQGTKITLDNPKLTGVQPGGGRYRIEARSGVQDITTPGIIDLIGVDSDIGMADHTTTHVLASHGIYDSKKDSMSLDGDIRIANTSGYTLSLKSMLLDFKQGTLVSKQRSRVDLKGGDVRADAIAISNNGHKITFDGRVESTFDAPDEPSRTTTAQTASHDVSNEDDVSHEVVR